jgi:hypothetical protein
VEHRRARILFDRPGNSFRGQIILPALDGDDAQQVMGVGMVGALQQNSLKDGLGRSRSSLLKLGDRLPQPGVDIAWHAVFRRVHREFCVQARWVDPVDPKKAKICFYSLVK